MPDPIAEPASGHDDPAQQGATRGGFAGDTVELLEGVSGILFEEQALGEVLRRVAELGRRSIPGATEVSMTLLDGGRARTVAFTGSLAVVLDERQYEDGFGPCMDAARTGQVISIEDTADSVTYPGFAGQAMRQGIRHTLSVGIPARRDVAAALNIYGDARSGPFTDDARQIATAFSTFAGVLLFNASAYYAGVAEAAGLRNAMVSRAEIEQAKGMIMRETRCTAEQAFDHLRQRSSASNRKLRDVAVDVLEENLQR